MNLDAWVGHCAIDVIPASFLRKAAFAPVPLDLLRRVYDQYEVRVAQMHPLDLKNND